MLDPVEAAARSIARDCGYGIVFAEGEDDLEHWRCVARNALAASVAAALEMREAEDARRAPKS